MCVAVNMVSKSAPTKSERGRLMRIGFCGTTPGFCGDKKVPEPSCSGKSATNGRVIGYYEGFNLQRPCHSKTVYVYV